MEHICVYTKCAHTCIYVYTMDHTHIHIWFIYFVLCVCVCVYSEWIWVYIVVHACVLCMFLCVCRCYVYMWRDGGQLQVWSTLFFETWCLIQLWSLGHEAIGSSCLYLFSAQIRSVICCSWLFLWVLGPKLRSVCSRGECFLYWASSLA